MAEETAVENATPESTPNPDATPSSGSDTGSGGGAAPWEYKPSYLDNGGAPGAGTQPPMAPPSGQASPAATQDAKSAMQAPAAPVPVVHPVRRSGLAGIVDEIRDAIAGKTQTSIGTDAQGNKYLKTTDLTGGQKWARIASTALHGAAAGWANGQGPGGAARALQAGVNVADKQKQQQAALTKEQQEEVKNDQLDKFNNVMQKQKILQNQFALTRMGQQATDDDVAHEKARVQEETDLKSVPLGTYEGIFDLPGIQKERPDIIKMWMNTKDVQVITHTDPITGKHDGASFYLRRAGVNDEVLPPGQPFHGAELGDDGKYKLVVSHTSTPMKRSEITAADDSSVQKVGAQKKEQAEEDDKLAQARLRDEQTKTQKTEQTKNLASATESRAKANEANAKAKQTVDASPLADEIGTGHMAVGRMSYLMARNQAVLEEVARKYPDFDSSKVEAYAKTYQDFTSGHTSTALNAGGTALAHLSELQALNTPMSHVPHSPEWTAYQNKAATVSTELAKFYGDATIPAIAQIKDTLTSTLPGNRDKAIKTQAQSMGDKLDSYKTQWDNAAPSKAYQANMPDISPKAKEARAALDPKYKARYVEELGNSPQQVQRPPQATQNAPQRPSAVPADYVWNPQGNNGRGSWDHPQLH